MSDAAKPVSDWRSYDEIADRYDRVWALRFEVVGRRIWSLMPPKPGDTVLDIGVGTGIVPRMVDERVREALVCVGCDRSAVMIGRARNRVVGLLGFVGDATALPIRGASIDLATASFVLSHVPNYARALEETRRVLKPSGTLAVSNWAPSSDPYSVTWSECLAGAVSKAETERAVAEVAPWEAHFSKTGSLEAAVTNAGFAPVRSDAVDVDSDFTVDQFLDDRELSSSGRLASRILGAEGWRRFRVEAAETFRARFGPSFRYQRRALMVIAGKA